jgi:hypothetical protein
MGVKLRRRNCGGFWSAKKKGFFHMYIPAGAASVSCGMVLMNAAQPCLAGFFFGRWPAFFGY